MSEQSQQGVDKYMQRMTKAKQQKEELLKIEEQVFKKGQNWKP